MTLSISRIGTAILCAIMTRATRPGFAKRSNTSKAMGLSYQAAAPLSQVEAVVIVSLK